MPRNLRRLGSSCLFSMGAACAVIMGMNTVALAEEIESTTSKAKPDAIMLDRILIVGNPNNVPGSAHRVRKETIEKHVYSDIHRIVAEVPGVNVQEEDGYGLRPNIGIRGSRSERSSDITLMEDGILIAPAPYAAPSAYYFPEMSRMEGVEIIKGAGSIKNGPRTNSGSVNLISSAIPSEPKTTVTLGVGSDSEQKALIKTGATIDNFGYVFDFTHRQSDGFKDQDNGGNTGFNIKDLMGKFRLNSDPSKDIYQEIELKFGVNEQHSNETYLGLTQADFDADPFRRYSAAQRDEFNSDHDQMQLRHFIEPFDGIDITTTAYKNNFKRNWYKLQSVTANGDKQSLGNVLNDPTGLADHLAILRGEANSDADALTIRANNRRYSSYGIQSIVGYNVDIANFNNQFEFGVRYHEDEEDRIQHEDGFQIIDGVMTQTSSGAAGSNANRIGSAEALALYVTDEIKVGKLTVSPGVRYETIRLKRKDYGKSDPGRTGVAVTEFTNRVSEVIPGIGATYALTNNVTVLGGVHKGFSPPAPPSSATDDADTEESINYETGVRYNQNAFRAEVIGFYNDYENLLGTDTLSSGNGEGSGQQFNGGEVEVMGIEAALGYDFSALLPEFRYRLPFRFSYTYTSAEFDNSFDSDFSEWGNVTSGDELPYIPEHQFFTSIGIADDKWEVELAGKYVDEMRTSAGSGAIPDGEGTDSHFIVDLAGEIEVHENVRLFGVVENLTDETYVAARRPAGARPGKPLTFLVGTKVTF